METEDMEEAELPELVADSDDEEKEEEEAGKRPCTVHALCVTYTFNKPITLNAPIIHTNSTLPTYPPIVQALHRAEAGPRHSQRRKKLAGKLTPHCHINATTI